MVAKHLSNDEDGPGLVQSLLHDSASGDTRQLTTSNRVAWTATSQSPSDDAGMTIRIMQVLIADAPILKRRFRRFCERPPRSQTVRPPPVLLGSRPASES